MRLFLIFIISRSQHHFLSCAHCTSQLLNPHKIKNHKRLVTIEYKHIQIKKPKFGPKTWTIISWGGPSLEIRHLFLLPTGRIVQNCTKLPKQKKMEE